MGKQTGIVLSGTYGGIIYYSWKGIPCTRRAPVKRKQTEKSKRTSKTFGEAIRLSKLLRIGLEPMLPVAGKRWLMYRMNKLLQDLPGELYRGDTLPAGELQGARHFLLTEHSDFQKLFGISITVLWQPGQKVIIRLPLFVPTQCIKAPPGTNALRLKFMLLDCNTKNISVNDPVLSTLELPYQDKIIEARELEMDLQGFPSQILILAVSIRYISSAGIIEKIKWMPAMIVEGSVVG